MDFKYFQKKNLQLVKLVVFGLLFFISCNDDATDPPTGPPDGPEEEELIADAGPDQSVAPRNIVNLDGTGSTGPDGFTYQWTYNGTIPEEEINFQNSTTATPTFIPPQNGLYVFTLVISYEEKTSEDVVQVNASGVLEIGGTLTEDLVLTDAQPDPDKPDYILVSDLIVPEGITFSIGDDNVVVQAEDQTGIVIRGLLTNAKTQDNSFEDTEFRGINGWKGIQIDGGTVNLQDAEIEKAGSDAFNGQTEAAALVFSGTDPEIINFRGNKFSESFSYDVLALTTVEGYRTFTNNTLSYTVPIKADITFIDTWLSDDPNHFPAVYDYIHLIPGGAETSDYVTTGFVFSAGKYFIDGDFRAGSQVLISNAHIYMKADAGILFEESLAIQSYSGGESIIEGINSSSWKGIAGLPNTTISMSGAELKNAGSSPISFGDFQTGVKAAIYIDSNSNSSRTIRDFKIINSSGFGIYLTTDKVNHYKMENGIIENTDLAGIRTTTSSVTQSIRRNNGMKFNMKEGVPAVLVEGEGTPYGLDWWALNDDNYYLIDADLDVEFISITLNAGVHLKFASGWALVFEPTIVQTFFKVKGTAENPVTIDSDAGTPGSWGGIYLGGFCIFQIEHCTITNGGEFILPGASEKANLVNNYRGLASNLYSMRNSTISNSDSYGIVKEPLALYYNFMNPENNNTFSNNNLGDYYEVPE